MEKKFYRFRAEDKKGSVRIKSKVDYDTLDILRKDSPLIENNQFFIANGTKFFDIVQFDDSLNFAISKKMKNLLDSNNITGWRCFPIVIENSKEEYFGFQNTGIAGPITNLEAVNNYETEFREFDITTWDGSDIFNLDGSLFNVCTERVIDLLQKERVSNLEIAYL
ncbi:hypothetical protein [Candidatus Pollutiaquabacter sp.]|uniref:hypothetical protein n=1 Tax=Candidatus Pollutiaquabacter sp. TaxID=3416354 RepID=UPI003C8783EB|nr:hypothetical protein [Bacteroidota bacterium]